jgi:hypothetical protein
MSKKILKVVLNKKVYFEIQVKSVAKEVSEGQLENFTSQISESIMEILTKQYTDGMELVH